VKTCRTPGCERDASLIVEAEAEGRCYLCHKYAHQLCEPSDQAIRRALGIRHGGYTPKLKSISPADVLSDEQMELDALIRRLASGA